VETFLNAIPGAGIFRSELLTLTARTQRGRQKKNTKVERIFFAKLQSVFSSYLTLA
jgi:hypothetical protein